MAMRVPTVDGPSVAPRALPDVRQSSIVSPELLGARARQVSAVGETLSTVGDELQRRRLQQIAQANALRVDDAVNQAQEVALRLQHAPNEGFTSQTGYAALSRPSGMPLADEYAGKLKESIDKIAGTLSNEDQKAAFAGKVGHVSNSFYGHALAHEGTQQREYNMSVRDATVSSARNALSLNFTDPANVQEQSTRIRSAIEGGQDEQGVFIPGSAQLAGKSAAWARQKADEAISDAHGNAIRSALEQGNVNLAAAYFKRYGGEMTAKDVLEVQGTLQKDYDTRLGATVGDQVFEAARPQIVPSDYTRLASLVMGQESGGRRYGTGGNLLMSAKGAQGEMQVMPATQRDPGYGIKPADMSGTKEQQADEIARVGRDYLAAMVKEYRGDIGKALAAYNAGPGAVNDAVKQAGPGGDFLALLPKETRDYVAGITARYAGGDGAPQKPTLADLHDQARASLGPNASPLAVRNAEERLTQRFTDQDKAFKQRAEEVTARAMQAVQQNGGHFSEIPASLRADLVRYAPDKVDQVMNYGGRVAKGDDTTNSAVYLRLSDPNVLRGMTEAQLFGLRNELSQSDYQHFANERANLLNPKAGGNGAGDLNSPAIKSTLDQRLSELGIASGKPGSTDAARVGTIRRFVDQEIGAAQQAAGKKFTDVETTAFIDRLFSTNITLRSTFLGIGVGSATGVPLLSMKPGDIPSADRDAIKTAFKNQGVTNPTDAQILNAFLHARTQRERQ